MEQLDFGRYHSFTAIDFETANNTASSICQIGLVRVEDGIITHKIDQLIRPPGNVYQYYNTRVHGITKEMTQDAPTFEDIWPQMRPLIEFQHVVAHNMQFESSCLRQTLQYYELPRVYYHKHCTVKIYKKGLAKLCAEYAIPLQHHNAFSDAQACALLFARHLQNSNRLL